MLMSSREASTEAELSCASGDGFPELPQDILLRIAGRLTMKEWLCGPAGVCQSLHKVPLPNIVLELNDHIVRNLPFPSIIHDDADGGMTP